MQSALIFIWKLLPLVLATGALLWVLYAWLRKSDEPVALIGRWIVTFGVAAVIIWVGATAKDEISKIVGVLVGAVGGLVFAILWVPSFCAFVAKQFTSLYDGGDQELEPEAFYSIAEAKRKRGKYEEAITEIRKQLERFPNDFKGWMMLADIQAENLKDLAGAGDTVEQIVTQEGHTPKNIAYALNRLADWHLKLGQDPDAARRALERVTEILPDTEEAQVAFQRISHLMTREMLLQKHEATPIHLPHSEENIGLRTDFTGLKPAMEDPAKIAADYVKHLEQFPHDNEVREKLALVYAEHYQRLDLATDQLEQLIAVPHQPAKQVVHWLNLLADLQIKLSGDVSLARQTLQRIIDGFPKAAAAENARSRIAYLNLQLKPQQKSQVVKLGSYEQNIGLKDRK